MSLKQLTYRYQNLDTSLTLLQGERDSLLKQSQGLSSRLLQLQGESFRTTLARDLLEKTSVAAREKAEAILEEAVTQVLRIVFGDGYRVKLVTKVRAGTPSTDVYVEKRIGLEEQLINLQNEGGGLKDVLSLAFFVTVSRLNGEDNGALVVMDEPTSAVSKGHAEATAEAIALLTDYLEKPSLIITHEREYLPNLIDHVYYVEQGVDGVSRVEEL